MWCSFEPVNEDNHKRPGEQRAWLPSPEGRPCSWSRGCLEQPEEIKPPQAAVCAPRHGYGQAAVTWEELEQGRGFCHSWSPAGAGSLCCWPKLRRPERNAGVHQKRWLWAEPATPAEATGISAGCGPPSCELVSGVHSLTVFVPLSDKELSLSAAVWLQMSLGSQKGLPGVFLPPCQPAGRRRPEIPSQVTASSWLAVACSATAEPWPKSCRVQTWRAPSLEVLRPAVPELRAWPRSPPSRELPAPVAAW